MSAARDFSSLDFSSLDLAGTPTSVADRSVVDTLRLEGDFRLPQSYADFASTLGYGLLCGLFIVYVPMASHPDSLPVRSRELHAMLNDSIDADLFEYEPDGSPALVRRLVPFGISENGHTLAWDPAEATGDRECMIYVVAPKTLAVRRGASDLYTFVEQCLDERVRAMLGSGYAPLKPTFRPMQPHWGAGRKKR